MSEEYQVIDLGPVVGADGGFGNITSDYVNDGGDPGVEITMTGEDRAKDFHFEFKNLVNDPLTASEIERIAAGETVHSSNTANGTSMSLFFAALSQLFAGIAHTHSADDIDGGTFGADRIENGSITKDKLEKSLGDSLSRDRIVVRNGMTAYRRGDMVTLTWYITTTVGANEFTELATLPEGWRPPGNMYFSAETVGASRLYIGSSGRVALYAFAASHQTQGTVSFPLP